VFAQLSVEARCHIQFTVFCDRDENGSLFVVELAVV
jgi:hypothetical protein